MSDYDHTPPSPLFRCVSGVAEAAARWGCLRPDLDPDGLRAWAERWTGLRDWGPDFGEEALTRLLTSARTDAGLTALGALSLDLAVRAALVTWLRQVDACRIRGLIAPAPLDRPIAILGLPRSGTTRLHHLLAAHPDSLFVPLWLALTPVRPPTADEWANGGGARRKWGWGFAAAMTASAPALDDIHAYGADLPVEDTHLAFTTFQSNQWLAWPLYSYLEWLPAADAPATYRALRRHLRLVGDQAPGRRWVLKSPGHFAFVDAFAAEFPEALLVVLHRDPRDVFSSLKSMMAAHYRPMARHPDLERYDRGVQEVFVRGADAFLRLRRAEAHRIVEITADDLRGDPLPLLERIFRRAGARWDDQVVAAIRAHAPVSHPDRHEYPRHDEEGSEAIRRRFADYMAATGLA